MNKRILRLLAVVIMLAGVCFLNGRMGKVDAAASDITDGDGFIAVEYTDLTQYRTESEKIAPDAPNAYENYIFAGWYRDAKCKNVYSNVTAASTLAYAKFVPDRVLSVKAQLKADANKDANTNMRLVSTVDSLMYNEVGFAVYYNGATTPVMARSTKVFKRIVASTTSGVDYNYSPKVVDVESEYFVTATLVNINKDNFGNGFYVKPYWETMDGTVVYGVNKYVTVNNGLDNTNINLTIKADAAFTESLTVTVGGTQYPATLALYDKESCYDGTYNYVNVTVNNRDSVLKSLSEITVTDGTTTGVSEYRNLMTKYSGTTASIDTSWYSEDEDNYAIATSADLYGLSNVIMKQGVNFANKKIYLISDIEVNKGRATISGWSLVEEDGTTAIKDATEYAWSKIGTYGTPFAGTFDGQGHTISGICYSGTEAYYGLFGKTSNSTIKNLKLKNSSFVYSGTSIAYLGGIAGSASGTFENVKSEAFVSSTHQNNGGIVGHANGELDITGCWYSGTMRLVGTNAKNAGGIVGSVSTNSVSSMEQCLFDGIITGDATGTEGYGGLCGQMYENAELSLSDNIVLGTITSSGNNFIGTIVGYIYGNSTTATLRVNNTYIKEDVCTRAIRVRSGVNIYYEDDAVVTSNINSSAYKKTVSSDDITGYKVWYNAHPILNLDFEEYWCLADNSTPQLRKLAETEDILVTLEGEGTKENPWIIKGKEELVAFSDMAQEHDFSGKYVSIGTEDEEGTLTITLNEGDTVDEIKANAVAEGEKSNWIAIGISKIPFAGTFNGNGNTISGLYLSTEEAYQGLFGYVNGATIKNFTLKTSYLEYTGSGNVYLGGIAGYGSGTFQSIKSEADIVSGGSRQGGIIGGLNGASTITDCWYSGTMDLTGGYGGGIVGMVDSAIVTMDNCLYTGNITGKATTTAARYSGLCGNLQGNSTLTVEDCLTIGTLTSTKNSNWMGPIVGYIDGTASGNATLIVNNTYSNAAAQYVIRYRQYGTVICDGTTVSGGNVSSSTYANIVSTDDIKGYGAWYDNSSVLSLDFENDWCLVNGSTPQLRTFTNQEDILPMLDGQGTEERPWLISKAEDLINLATIAKSLDFNGKFVSLINSIVVNEGDTVDEVKANAVTKGGTGNWTPIGSESLPFAGNFNGNGNTIGGLYYKGTGTNIGLFGYTANSSTISNLILSNTCYFESENSNTTARIGSVAGCVQGTLDTIKSEATVVSVGQENGGIAGTIRYSGAYSASVRQVKFTNVWFAGTLSLTSNVARFSGGMVGKLYAPNREIVIEHCLVTGTITSPRLDSNSQLGGIVGQANDYRSLAVSDSLVASVIQSVNRDTGVIFGAVDETVGYSLNNVYGVDGEATNGVIYDHGVTGVIKPGTVNTNSVNYEVLDIEDAKGTDVWYNGTLTLDFVNYWNPVVDGTPELKSFPTNGVDIWSGKGTQVAPWIISDKNDLELLSTLAQTYNFSGKFIQLGADEQAGELIIAVNEGTIDEIKEQKPTNWVPIGKNSGGKRFAGTFDGKGNVISGLYYVGSGSGIGLFGAIDKNATVQNLKLTNSYFEYTSTSGNAYIGSVAGFGFGTFNNVKSTAEVVCESAYAGGLVGGLGGYGEAYFNDCWFDGTLRVGKQAKYCGGILGGNNHPVHMQNCLNTGTILINKFNGSSISVGGICGYVNSDIEITNCLNAKSITMNRGYVSAILGEINSGTTTLTNVYAVVGDGADQSYNGCEYYGHKADAATVTLTDNSWRKLTNEQLCGENAITYASGLFGANTHWVTGDLYPVLNMTGEVYPSIPVMSVSTVSNTSTKLTGDGNLVTTVTGTTKENYDDYLTSVVAAQFVKVADNTIDNSVYSTTYTRDGLVLCVTYFAKQNQTSISYYEGAVSEHLTYNADDVAGNAGNAKTTMSMMELFAYGNSFVIQLKNGHFLISDGGMEYEIEYLLDYLDAHTPNGETPVVDGWFITHAHEDHCGAINAFYDREDLVSRVHVEGVYYSSPNDENVLKNAGGGESKDYVLTRVVRGILRNSKGEPTAFYRPQTGQRYYFNDTTIDILLAQEQLSVDATEANIRYRGNLNSSSTVCLFTSENQTCLLSGDLEETGFDWLFGNYNETMFSTLDFFTLNHHGFNTSETIANKITANTVLLTLKDNYDDRCAEHIEVLIGKAKESMAWGNGTVVFTFPHTAGNNSYQRLAPNTWKYHEGVDRPVQENIDGTLQ